MITLAINLSFIEIIALPIVALIFGATFYFFLKSRRSLQETLEAHKRLQYPGKKKDIIESPKRRTLAILEEQFQKIRTRSAVKDEPVTYSKRTFSSEGDIIEEIKSTIAHQQ